MCSTCVMKPRAGGGSGSRLRVNLSVGSRAGKKSANKGAYTKVAQANRLAKEKQQREDADASLVKLTGEMKELLKSQADQANIVNRLKQQLETRDKTIDKLQFYAKEVDKVLKATAGKAEENAKERPRRTQRRRRWREKRQPRRR